jgi:predicted DNA binding protein
VRRLVRSGDEGPEEDLVLVDRSDLTDRQREVLATAHEMGYFAYPKRANAERVAAELDIGPSTFAEHVAAAQDKLLAAVLS